MDWGDNCKHIWAVLKEVDQYLSTSSNRFPAEISVDTTGIENSFEQTGCFEPSKIINWRSIIPWNSSAKTDQNTSKAQCYYPFFILNRHRIRACNKLIISLDERYMKGNGEWGKIRRMTMLRAENFHRLSEANEKNKRAISLALLGAVKQQLNYGESHLDEFTIPWGTSPLVIKTLAETGHFFYKEGNWSPEVPLKIATGCPLNLAIRLDHHSENMFRLNISLSINDRLIEIKDPDIVIFDNPCWIVYQREIYFLDEGIPHNFLKPFRVGSPVLVNKQEVTDFLHACEENLGSTMKSLQLPDGRTLEEITDCKPDPELFLRIEGETIYARLGFIYIDKHHVDYTDNLPYITDFKIMQRVLRNQGEEEQLAARLADAGFKHNASSDKEHSWTFDSGEADISEVLKLLIDDGWHVFGRENRHIRSFGGFNITVSSNIDWFDLKGELLFDDSSLSLQDVLKLWKKKERLVLLDDGTLGIIPWKWLEQNAFALDLGQRNAGSDKNIRFRTTQICLLDMMLDSQVKISTDERYQQMLSKLKDFDGISQVEIPKGFKGKLRSYQKKGLDWLAFLNEFGFGGCLADDMGLGKTVQVLSLLQRESELQTDTPSLVVVPTSLVYNWQQEAERFTPGLKVLCYTGLKKFRNMDDFHQYDIILTTYGILRREIKTLKNFEFNYVILDESQAIKNPRTQVAKSACLLHSRHRLSMTGTPVENHLGDLWSQFEFLNPSFLGKYNEFIKRFSDKDNKALEPLRRITYPFILRRLKEDVEVELPPRIEQVVYCDMNENQRKLYTRLRDQLKTSLLGNIHADGTKMKVLTGLLRLRQICCHPLLAMDKTKTKTEYDSGKFAIFREMIVEILEEGHKVLVFSQFTSMLSIIREWMDKEQIHYQYLDGRTKKRGECVKEFQENAKFKVFLISLKAGGMGLNLTAADYVFIYDPWWNPAVEVQAMDRAHRIGQVKKVIAYRFIAKDSVEEKILQLQNKKKSLVSSVIAKDENFIKKLSEDDIKYLFS